MDTDQQTDQQSNPTPSPLVDHTGAFSKNWRDSLPEDIRGDKSLDVVTDFPNAIKQLVNANKMIGRDKVVVPGPNATDQEKSAFFDAIGRPKTPADYKVEVPKDLGEIFTKDRMDKAKALAHKLGATQEQFAGYMQDEIQNTIELLKGDDEALAKEREDAIKDLHKRFGGAYDERMHLSNRMVSEMCKDDPSKQMRILGKFGNDPDFIEFCSDAGAKLVEHKVLIGQLTGSTPKENEKRLAELRMTPGFMIPDAEGKLLSDTNPFKHKQILEEIDRITNENIKAEEQARRYGA